MRVPDEPDVCRLSNELLLGYKPPVAAVVAVIAIVAHQHVFPRGHGLVENVGIGERHSVGYWRTAAKVAARVGPRTGRERFLSDLERYRAQQCQVRVGAQVLGGYLHVLVADLYALPLGRCPAPLEGGLGASLVTIPHIPGARIGMHPIVAGCTAR